MELAIVNSNKKCDIYLTKYKYSSLKYAYDFAKQLEAPLNAATSPPRLKNLRSSSSSAGDSSLPLACVRTAWLQYENYTNLEKAT